MSKFENIRNTFKDNLENHQGIFIYLPGLTDWQKKEAKFHDQIIADEKEVHQLNSLRNIFYHHYFKKWLYKLPADSVILEIGAGSGYDILPLVKKGYQLIESDISYQSVRFTKEQIEQNTTAKNQVIYLVSDGQNLPLENNSLEAVFLVAAFHHFQDQNRALAEIKRVTQKEGLIILAMEPTKFLMKFGKF
ncbi:class I SAM-dependent methyltransferase, partial [Patescibacteria group bacterium]|nr:class I SAM-dependent methyltransferase [Patescibacteria group bacterium]